MYSYLRGESVESLSPAEEVVEAAIDVCEHNVIAAFTGCVPCSKLLPRRHQFLAVRAAG